MKLSKKFITCLTLLTFSLPSCAELPTYEKVVNSRISLEKQEGIDKLFLITSKDELFTLTRHQDLVLFVTKPGCPYCDSERKYLERFIKDTNTIIYEVNYLVYSEAYDDASNKEGEYKNNLPSLRVTPTYFFYKNGKVVNSQLGRFVDQGNDIYEIFYDLFSSYVYPINLYRLNDRTDEKINNIEYHLFQTNDDDEETNDEMYFSFTSNLLDKQIAKDEKSLILYSYRLCIDCVNFKKYVFLDSLIQHADKKVYYYETDAFYRLKNHSDFTYKQLGYERWKAFSEKYHISFYDDRGVVPTLATYQKNEFLSWNVYANQGEVVYNDDSTISMNKVFYEEEKKMKSKTKVEKGDNSSEAYFQAINELKEQFLKYDNQHAKKYLDEQL